MAIPRLRRFAAPLGMTHTQTNSHTPMITSRFAQLALMAAALTPASLLAQYGAGREVQFTIRVENVSTPTTLKLSNGTTAPAPTAPILWTVTDEGNPLFTAGKPDRGQGLERLA